MRNESAQLALWRGRFGAEYSERNAVTEETIRNRVAMWRRILAPLEAAPPRSILEVGANVGQNMHALAQLTEATLYALEPNEAARARLAASGVLPASRVLDGSAEAIPLDAGAVDLAFTSGVLIHIAPDRLTAACREIHRVAKRYVVCAEYFSDKEEEVTYRGERDVLFKRDFGAFWLDNFGDLELVDYGFLWRRATGLDNITWWLFRKS